MAVQAALNREAGGSSPPEPTKEIGSNRRSDEGIGSIGVWSNGRASGSGPGHEGSIPSTPATNLRKEARSLTTRQDFGSHVHGEVMLVEKHLLQSGAPVHGGGSQAAEPSPDVHVT